MSYPLFDFDPSKMAVIHPHAEPEVKKDFPEICIGAFSYRIVEKLVAEHKAEQIHALTYANGEIPVYRIVYNGVPMAFFMAAVGASLCCAMLDELIACGGKKFVYFGSCGVLDHKIDDAHIIVPTVALRDEGTSFHYCAPSDEIALDKHAIHAVTEALESLHIPYVCGKIWTTDAFYRETEQKVQTRKEAGCIAVDMECSALTAVAQFRGVILAEFVYAADSLTAEDGWDARGLSDQGFTHSDHYLAVALETALRL